ncbi:2-keto-4-pentenoate hydratase [Microtetraspora sp. NBRC 13810]|nr:2-keto-4-pentenoate hydratase [Microtetraspora sp. NBRC 13810]
MAAARERAGSRVAGYKIGLTSKPVQEQFGVFQPDFGLVFDDMLHSHGGELERGAFLQPRVEAEVAFVLATDIETPSPSVADVLRATGFVLPAIEIVDSRIAGWDITIGDTIADNASSGGVVLGTTPRSLDGLDLAEVGMVLEHDGEDVSHGSGAACMGSPVVAATWLARELVRRGRPPRAGDVIMTGALGPMVDVPGPGRFTARLSGLGQVEVTFVERGK